MLVSVKYDLFLTIVVMEEQSRSCSPHGLATMADQELQRVLEALQQRERDVEKLRAQLKEVRLIIVYNTGLV